MARIKRKLTFVCTAVLVLLTLWHFWYHNNARLASVDQKHAAVQDKSTKRLPGNREKVVPDASTSALPRPHARPSLTLKTLPTGEPTIAVPRIQHAFVNEGHLGKGIREARLTAVKEAFLHSWFGYKSRAWLKDEVAPVTGGWSNTFGGWAATLIDSLDTLYIMGFIDEFEAAVQAVDKIDFDTPFSLPINVFETTIRYLGGLLGAYDISGGEYPVLLRKAREVGEVRCISRPEIKRSWNHTLSLVRCYMQRSILLTVCLSLDGLKSALKSRPATH